MSGWVGGTEQAQTPPIQRSPPMFLGRFWGARVSWLKWTACLLWPAFSSGGGFCFPVVPTVSSACRHRGPLSSLSHDSHPFLEGKPGSQREQVV